jgi:hypothetical protein
MQQSLTRDRASAIPGNDLRRLRLRAGLTCVQLATLMDVHPGTVRNIESRGPISRSLARLYLLCVAAGGPAHVREALAHAESVLRA